MTSCTDTLEAKLLSCPSTQICAHETEMPPVAAGVGIKMEKATSMRCCAMRRCKTAEGGRVGGAGRGAHPEEDSIAASGLEGVLPLGAGAPTLPRHGGPAQREYRLAALLRGGARVCPECEPAGTGRLPPARALSSALENSEQHELRQSQVAHSRKSIADAMLVLHALRQRPCSLRAPRGW